MKSPLFCDRRWRLAAAFAVLFVVGLCSADTPKASSLASARGVESASGRERYLQDNGYYNGNNNNNGYYNGNNNNNGYNGNYDGGSGGGSGSNSNNGYNFWNNGSNNKGSGNSNYQFGSRIDNDDFFHWLEILGVVVGVALALVAVGFAVYCLLYPFILCCGCVQSEADAFHTIDKYDVSSKHTLSSRPSDSYSMA